MKTIPSVLCPGKKLLYTVFILCCLSYTNAYSQQYQTISAEALKDKIHAYWLGQLVGNYMGFPFENVYKEKPVPILIDRYFTANDLDSFSLQMNHNDRRAYGHIMADAMGGAWSDDDTDFWGSLMEAVEYLVNYC